MIRSEKVTSTGLRSKYSHTTYGVREGSLYINPNVDYDWIDYAECGKAPEKDKKLFLASFPSLRDAQRLARTYCDHCPVKRECLNWAHSDGHFAGVAGGKMFTGAHHRKTRKIQTIRRPGA